MIFHRHKLSEVKSDGYQYCLKCGKSFIPPCLHQWEELDKVPVYETEIITMTVRGYLYTQKCKKCKYIREYTHIAETYFERLLNKQKK